MDYVEFFEAEKAELQSEATAATGKVVVIDGISADITAKILAAKAEGKAEGFEEGLKQNGVQEGQPGGSTPIYSDEEMNAEKAESKAEGKAEAQVEIDALKAELEALKAVPAVDVEAIKAEAVKEVELGFIAQLESVKIDDNQMLIDLKAKHAAPVETPVEVEAPVEVPEAQI